MNFSDINLNQNYSCCFTGYRPQKFKFNMNEKEGEYLNFENRLIEAISSLINSGCDTFYSGMALGFDIIAAECVLLLKNAYKNKEIKLYCVIPFKEQSVKYSSNWLDRYNEILLKSDKNIILAEKYTPSCYQKRNIFMVDKSDYVLTWFDGQNGGTKNTINYANKKGRHIINIYETNHPDIAEQLSCLL